MWSKRSVGPEGTFVQDEATRAQERQVYIPVAIDKVGLPLGFGERQCLPLTGWRGDRSDPRYQAVLSAVRRFAGEAKPAAEPDAGRMPTSRRALMVGGIASAVVAAAGAGIFLRPGTAAASGSIAVLPFANLSGDPSQGYFSDGIAEEIRTALSRIGQLQVVARTSSEAVRDEDVKTAARTLGVSNILTGSVRRSPTTVRVAAQLIDGESGIERWSQVYDRPIGDVLAIQSEIAQNVAQSLFIELGQNTRLALTSGGTQNAEALDLFLQADPGRVEHGEAGYRRALKLIDSAIALDPNYAQAYARKGLLLNFLAGIYARSALERTADFERAASMAKRAIKLTPNLPSGYLTLASVQTNQLEFAKALRNFEHARRLPGRRDLGMRSYAVLLSRLKRHGDALRLANSLVPLDPLNAASYNVRAIVQYEARNYAEAVRSAERSLEITPGRAQSRNVKASALLMMGQTDQARQQLALMPLGDVDRLTGEAIVAARQGAEAGSKRVMAELTRQFDDAVNYKIATIHAQQGESDEAFAALDRAWESRDPALARLQVDPLLDPIRRDPRFPRIVSRLNFPA